MSTRAWTLFAAVSVLWGIPYLFIKLAVEDLSPVMVAWGRIAVAFAILLPYAIHKGALRGLGRHWKPLLIYSVVEIVLPWPLIGFGEQRVTSGLAAILIAAVPLVVALMALRVDPEERAEGSRLVGLLIGFAGVVVLLGLDVAGRPGELLGAFAILLAAVGYAAGPMIIKHRLGTMDPLGPVTASMGISALILAAPAFGIGADRDAVRRHDRLGGGPRSRLQRARLPALLRPDRRGRARPGDGDHLREPGRRGRAGRHAARRGARAERGRRPAAHPGRLVAVDRRADAPRPDDARPRPANRGSHRPSHAGIHQLARASDCMTHASGGAATTRRGPA